VKEKLNNMSNFPADMKAGNKGKFDPNFGYGVNSVISPATRTAQLAQETKDVNKQSKQKD
jgi:hypothetical protein